MKWIVEIDTDMREDISFDIQSRLEMMVEDFNASGELTNCYPTVHVKEIKEV